MESQKTTLQSQEYKYKGREKEYKKEWREKNKGYHKIKMREYREKKRNLRIMDIRIKMLGNPEDTFTKEDLEYIQSIQIGRSHK